MFIFHPRCLKIPVKCTWQNFFISLMEYTRDRDMENRTIKLNIVVYSPHFSRLKTGNFTSGWSETAWGGGLVLVRPCHQNRNVARHIWNILGIRHLSVVSILVQNCKHLRQTTRTAGNFDGNPAHSWGKMKTGIWNLPHEPIGASKKPNEKKVGMLLNHIG
jgi:hypothetical protein